MSNRAWMPLHIEDYLADTGHLTGAEHGAYILLIMHYWREGSLPADERLIMRLAKMSPDQWTESRDILMALFTDGWQHKRIDAELAKADEIIGKRKRAAEQMHSRRNACAEQVHSTCNDTGGYTSNLEPLPSGSNEPSGRAPAKPSPRSELEKVLDQTRAQAVIDHRQRKKAPLTAHAAALLAKKLALFADPNAAADKMIEKGWQSIEPTWEGVGALAPQSVPAEGRTTWIPDDDPRWPDLAARHERERGRKVSAQGSRAHSGLGWYFPNEWLEPVAA